MVSKVNIAVNYSSFRSSELDYTTKIGRIAVNLGVLGLGTVIGWSSPAIPSLELALNATHTHANGTDIKELTTMDKSWIGSIVNV